MVGGEPDSARGWERSGEGVEHVYCTGQMGGKGQGRMRTEKVAHGTARRVVAVARRAAVLGVRAGRWRRVEGPRDFGRTQGWWRAGAR